MIRQFQPGDAQACSNLIRICIEQDAHTSPPLREKLLQTETAHLMLERARLYYVAVFASGEEIAGVCGLEMNEIRLLLVYRKFQCQGIGRTLLKHLEAMVPNPPFTDIFVYSTPAGEGFYRAHGYQSKGEYHFDLGDSHLLPTIFMTKSLVSFP